jgi:hypothetical protein
MTVPACASATTAVIEAALAGSVCRSSSAVTIMISNRPSPPPVPGTQLALRIFTRWACSLAPGMPHLLGPLAGWSCVG